MHPLLHLDFIVSDVQQCQFSFSSFLSLCSCLGEAIPSHCLPHDLLAQEGGTEEMDSCHHLQATLASYYLTRLPLDTGVSW